MAPPDTSGTADAPLQFGLPGAPSQSTGFPENSGFVVFERFDGLNTKPPRPAIQDGEMAWCDGWMPIGPSNLRTLPDWGAPIYTASGALTVQAMWFYNLGTSTDPGSGTTTPYCAALLSDGSLVQIPVLGGAAASVLPPATVASPTSTSFWATQWNSRYLALVADQTNGFWLWNGATLFSAGGLSPEATITNGGKNYTSPPTVTLISTAGGGAAFSPVVENGSVVRLDVTAPGSGLGVTDYVGTRFTGGGSDDHASATPVISPNTGPVINVAVLNAGNGKYASGDVLRWSLSGGSPTSHAALALQWNNGTIPSVSVITGGSGYSSSPALTLDSDKGTGFSVSVEIGYGEISSITLTNGGSGYKSPPTVNIIGDGQDAAATAIVNAAGQVTSIQMTNRGHGYTKAIVTFSGGNNAAEATVRKMPVGVKGTTAEVFNSRLWVGGGRRGFFTDANSVANFDDGGVFQALDSFQRRRYVSYRQSNGFLWLVSDSSVNYISGVQATTGASTIFNNLNADPQIGTVWPATMQLFSRALVYANSFGVFELSGGAAKKVSLPLDGVYNTVIQQGGGATLTPSSAIATIFGIPVYMLLFPIINPLSGVQENKLLMWDGQRWWTSSQGGSLTYIASQELDSTLTAWGTDGRQIRPLFQTPSHAFGKVVRSKLWATPSYWFEKTVPEVTGLLNFYNTEGTVAVAVDNESGSSVTLTVASGGTLQWTNDTGQPISWTGLGGTSLIWGAPGLEIFGPQRAGQVGVLTGLTISTDAPDVALLSASMLEQNFASRA